MAYQTRSSQGIGGRFMSSIGGALVGGLLFLISFPLLFWNEGRAVQTAKSLEEGASKVVSVSADKVDDANNGNLVHVTGKATTDETLTDPDFGVKANALKLNRKAEMYQYKEVTHTDKKKTVGGSEETVTTYTYEPVWSETLIDSSSFKDPDAGLKGYKNPTTMPYQTQDWKAKNVTLGVFALPLSLTDQITATKDLPVSEGSAPPAKFKVDQGGFYSSVGKTTDAPAVGDVKITYKIVEPQTISIISKQTKNTFEPYQAEHGDALNLLELGDVDAAKMFQMAQDKNTNLTWILRFGGFAMMAFGMFLVFKPLSVMGDIIPFIGNVMGAILGFIAVVIAFGLSLVTISLAWVVYRPIIGIPLLLVGLAGLGAGAYFLIKSKKAKPAVPQTAPKPV